MKQSNISRRDVMRGLASGALPLAIVPAWAGEQDLTPKGTAAPARGEQPVISLPPFFDCNKYLGPGFPQRPDFPRAVDLLSHLDRLGIDRAVAWHTAARDLHPMKGNEQLLREIEGACAKTGSSPPSSSLRQ